METRSISSSETPWYSSTCSETRDTFLATHHMVVKSENPWFDNQLFTSYDYDYLPTAEETLVAAVAGTLSDTIYEVQVSENTINLSSNVLEFFGLEDQFAYTKVHAAEATTWLDQDLTRGYAMTLVFQRTALFSSTHLRAYSWMNLLMDLAAALLALYCLLWLLMHLIFPIYKLANQMVISEVYRVVLNESTPLNRFVTAFEQ